MVAALTMNEVVFLSNARKERGSHTRFDSVTVYLDNVSTLHVVGNHTYSSRVKRVALLFFFIQDQVKGGRINIHDVKTENQLADIGTKHLRKNRNRHLNKLIQRVKCLTEEVVDGIFTSAER